jgi:hypothetical protein
MARSRESIEKSHNAAATRVGNGKAEMRKRPATAFEIFAAR